MRSGIETPLAKVVIFFGAGRQPTLDSSRSLRQDLIAVVRKRRAATLPLAADIE